MWARVFLWGFFIEFCESLWVGLKWNKPGNHVIVSSMGCVIVQLIMITIYCWPWIAWYKVLFMNVQPVKKCYYNSLDTEHRTFRCTHMSMKLNYFVFCFVLFFFHTGSIWPSFICLWWWRWKFIWYWKFWWSCWLHWIWCYQCTSAKGPSECCCQEYIGKKTAQYIIFHLLL